MLPQTVKEAISKKSKNLDIDDQFTFVMSATWGAELMAKEREAHLPYVLVTLQKDAFDIHIEKSTLYGTQVIVYKTPYIWQKYKKESWYWASQFPEDSNLSLEIIEHEAAKQVKITIAPPKQQ